MKFYVFFLRATGWPNGEDDLCRTYVIVPKMKKKLAAEPSQTLFFPRNDTTELEQELLDWEKRLKQHCIPLTCGQRCADWFLMRRFRVTGTMGAVIARRDSKANEFLSTRASISSPSCP